MKKNFPLTMPNHAPARVLEQIKSDVRKYIKRERKKTLPEGVDFWDFACKVGAGDSTPETKHVEELSAAIDQAATTGSASVYVEILATAGHRLSKTPKSENP
jgi:Family of unknown function (DUF6172)